MTYYGAKELAESFRTVRRNTIQVAEDIPEEKYSFRAAPDTMSVGELLAHLACAPHWAQQLFFNEKKTAVTMEDFGRWMGEAGVQEKALTSKAAIVAALKANGDKFASQLEACSEAQLRQSIAAPMASKSTFEMLLGIKEHEMHHRAQLFLIERMCGIVPHLTRARQERMAQMAGQAKS
ncbi:MAG TPA: DinB family protein [Vicinamibacterales bacterium]|nr:DinB family protein [Vicinamibacterales bacterium]